MAAITILNQDNVPTGPFTREQVASKLQSGEVTLDSLAFTEGLSQWTPLRDVLAKVDAKPAVAPPPTPASIAPAYSYAATMQPPPQQVYAGFWLRVAAYILDALIVGIPISIVGGIVGGICGFSYGMSHPGSSSFLLTPDGSLNPTFIVMEVGLMTFSLLVKWLYFALQESSSAQATVGKRVLGLKVINLEGNRIGFGQASGRFFGKILSGMILCVGYMMAGFTERKQALHDMVAGTLVVRN
jgi:uncharacterized RDD family membrane protein YckC